MFWIVVLLIIIAALSALCLGMKYHLVDKQVRIDELYKKAEYFRKMAEFNKEQLEEANAECNLTQRRLDLADEQLSDIRKALNKGD